MVNYPATIFYIYDPNKYLSLVLGTSIVLISMIGGNGKSSYCFYPLTD